MRQIHIISLYEWHPLELYSAQPVWPYIAALTATLFLSLHNEEL